METETLILGAGAAGLAAAQVLAQHKHAVRVLEARSRIGGRAFTRHEAGVPAALELGAEFIHGLPPEILLPARRLSIPFADGVTTAFFFDGENLRQADDGGNDHLATALDRIRKYQGPDIAYDAFAAEHLGDLPEHARGFARQYIEGFNAADASRIGVHGLKRNEEASEQIEGDRLARFVRGYDSFLEHLLSPEFPVDLSTAVHTLRWQAGRVEAHARAPDGAPLLFTAKRVIVTLPLRLLQQRSVAFIPEPAAIFRAADRIAAGQAMKLILLFRNAFWEELDDGRYRDLAFLYAPGEQFPTWWAQLPVRAPLLTAWAGGAQTNGLLHCSCDELLALAIQTLSKVFRQPRERIAALIQSHHHHAWHADPYAGCAYSWMPTGAADAPARLCEPVDDTLFFAGEHTNDQGEIGTLNGALYTGQRAARQVLASLGGIA